jgi:hypothetical protein
VTAPDISYMQVTDLPPASMRCRSPVPIALAQ